MDTIFCFKTKYSRYRRELPYRLLDTVILQLQAVFSACVYGIGLLLGGFQFL